jgi:hypothetical protein
MQRAVFGRLSGAGPSCRMTYPDPNEARIYSWMQSAAAGFPNASMIDMNDEVCPHGACDAERKDLVIFRDDHHLATHYARLLGPVLARRLGLSSNGESPE